MTAPVPTTTPELIDCIEGDRSPTPVEVARVAAHIRSDLVRSDPAFSWGEAQDDEAERLLLLRAAQAALRGG